MKTEGTATHQDPYQIGHRTAAANRDESLIPDRSCEHGSRLRSCGFPTCISTRAGILRRAARLGLR